MTHREALLQSCAGAGIFRLWGSAGMLHARPLRIP